MIWKPILKNTIVDVIVDINLNLLKTKENGTKRITKVHMFQGSMGTKD